MNNFKVGSKVIVVKKIDRNPEQKYEIGSVGVVIESKQGEEQGYVYFFNEHVEEVYWVEVVPYEKGSAEQSAEQIREEILRIDTLIEKSKKDIEDAEKKRGSLIEQLREKGFLLYEKEGVCRCAPTLSVEDVHVGDHLILTKDSHNFRIQQGCIVSVEVNDKSGLPFRVCCLSTGNRDWVALEDVKRV